MEIRLHENGLVGTFRTPEGSGPFPAVLALGGSDGGSPEYFLNLCVSEGFACLGLACWTVGGDPSLAGLLIAFTAAKAVASVPLAPGGLGFVDGTLIATLTAAGMSASQSLAAVFVYRMVSFVIVAVVGWIVIAVLYRSHRIDDAELDLEREHQARSLLTRRPASPPPVEGDPGPAPGRIL